MQATTPDHVRRSRSIALLGAVAWTAVAVSLYLVFFVAREAQVEMGGQLQRIFYFHVPSAWIAYLAFAIVFLGSIAYLRTRARRWDLLAAGAAEIGVLFTTLVLVTGPIWARPVWGAWWVWDARLTSTLVMWLTYLGYLFLRQLAVDESRVGGLAAAVGIFGFLNVPLVHFSVTWWRTLHPSGPTVADPTRSSGLGGPELLTFCVSLVAFTLLFAWLLALRVRVGALDDRLRHAELAGDARAVGPARRGEDPVVQSDPAS